MKGVVKHEATVVACAEEGHGDDAARSAEETRRRALDMTLHEHVGFPGTDLCVSPIGLGPSAFAADVPEWRIHGLLDAFVDAGGNFIATGSACAPSTGTEPGRAERIVGDWLCRRRRIRGRLVVAVCTRRLDRVGGGSADVFRSVREDVGRSLAALGMDRVEMYCLNGDTPGVPVKEIVDFTEAMRGEGKVGFFAASNWSADRLEEARAYASRIGAPGVVAHHAIFNLASWSATPRTDGRGEIDGTRHGAHRRTGLPLLASQPRAGGVIARAVRATVAGASGPEHGDPLVQTVATLAAHHRCSPDALVLAYLLHQPFPVFPMLGHMHIERLYDAFESLCVRLTPKELEKLASAALASTETSRARGE